MSDQMPTPAPEKSSEEIFTELREQLRTVDALCASLRRTNVAFGKFIKLVRTTKNISIEHVADECRVSRETAESWERGMVPDRVETRLLAEALMHDPTEVIEAAGYRM